MSTAENKGWPESDQSGKNLEENIAGWASAALLRIAMNDVIGLTKATSPQWSE